MSLLVDTGAAVTLIRKETWDRIPRADREPPRLTPCTTLGLVGADGSPLQPFGSALVMLTLGGTTMPVEAVVVDSLTSEKILGLDFLRQQKAMVDLVSEQITLHKQDLSIPLHMPAAT